MFSHFVLRITFIASVSTWFNKIVETLMFFPERMLLFIKKQLHLFRK